MTSSSSPISGPARVPDQPAACAVLLETALARASGEDVAAVSLTLDYGAPVAAGDEVTVEAWIDRATRTLVFAHGRVVKADGALAASGSAVFRRAVAATPA
ncbi:PaaI family thioesterase [Phenylobacterium sp.]|uniref:PaaI family thioesterase n=1 Tax=Phenylobacterium sp. TaxID=1871053 RepID=UPI0017E0E7DA|nr:hotdog domain-containing protein [Phenylobacterium sp.]MBA4795031.1 hypothetical protein [Phenylobacterium sp.]MBC7167062.1 hypothetical protein [Phenylobacterium sp.]